VEVLKGRDIMKTKKYYLGLAVVIGILCVPALGEVESLPPGTLLGQPNPALAGIDKLCVVITQLDDEPNKDGLDREELETRIINKLKECGIKVTAGIAGDILNIQELRVGIEMLKLKDLQQYVFHIQTSLATKVSLSDKLPLCIKADVWKTEPTMQAVSVQSMPAAVTSAVLEQVEAFIHAYLAANPPNKRPTDANDISIAPEEHLKPVAKSTPAEYKYVASKNSSVFHKPDCIWAKKIKPENLVGYSSRDEAINAGKRPCRQCNP
jgi:hypothetical protein